MPMTKREDGRFQVSVQDGFDPAGKPKRKYFYGKTQKEAKQKRDEYLRAKAAGLRADEHPTVRTWANKWLSIYGEGSYSVTRSNRIAVDRLIAFMGDKPLDKVLRSDVQSFANTVKEMSFSTVKKTQNPVQNLFRAAIADHLLLTDPTEGVKWDYGEKGTHRALEPWETEFITSHWQDQRFGLLAMIMLYAGLRRGEALALTWGDIKNGEISVHRAGHFENNRLVIEDTTKTESGVRVIPIFSAALSAALAQCRGIDTELVSSSCCAGGVLTESAFTRGWEGFNAAMQNLLNGREAVRPGQRNDLIPVQAHFSVRPHDLRHSFCTMLLEQGCDLKTAQMLMGHADEKMIMEVYAHLSKKMEEDSLRKLRAAFG